MRVLPLVRKVLQLRTADRLLLTRAYISLLGTDLRLRLFGFRGLVLRANCGPVRRTVGDAEIQQASRYAHWLEVASRRHVVRARCLHRSLALSSWLTQHGVPGQLRIGVRKRGTELTAHAWVEIDGRAVNELPAAVVHFRPLGDLNGEVAAWVVGMQRTPGDRAAGDTAGALRSGMRWT